ncbi:MAG: DnaB-like helicase N-terminal domain-containing protein, partial [Novosphingobium sp.]
MNRSMLENDLIAPAQDAPHRSLPANIEAEAAYLGAILIDNRVIENLQVQLRPEHFFEPLHTRLYERILNLVDRQVVVTPVTLKPYFESDPALQELGGISYLARLTADGQGLLSARDLAAQIYDLALLR